MYSFIDEWVLIISEHELAALIKVLLGVLILQE